MAVVSDTSNVPEQMLVIISSSTLALQAGVGGVTSSLPTSGDLDVAHLTEACIKAEGARRFSSNIVISSHPSMS